MADKTTETTQKLARNARRVVGFFLITSVLAGIISTITYLSEGVGFQSLVITWVVAITTVVGFWLTRRGKGTLAVGLILVILWISLLSSPFRNSGNSLALGLLCALLTITIAAQTLTTRLALQTIAVGAAIGLLTILLDWFGPADRPTTPQGELIIVYIFGAGLVLVNAFFIFRQIREYSLRAKLTIAFLFVAILAVVSLSVLTNLITRSELTRQVGTNLQTLANTVSKEMGNQLIAQIEILQVAATQFEELAQEASEQYSGDLDSIQSQLLLLDNTWRAADDTDPIIQDVLINEAADELRELQAVAPSYAEIFLTDQYGANIAATNRTTDYYQADEAWWQVAYNGGEGSFYISSPVFDESSQTFGIDFAIPVFAQGEVVGILHSTYDATALTKILEAVELGGSGHADLRVADDLLLGFDLADLQAIDLETQNQLNEIAENFGEIFLEGENVLASQVSLTTNTIGDPRSRAVENLGWAVIVHQDEVEAFAPIETVTRSTILFSLGLLAVTGILAVYVSNQFSKPIVNLTNVAEQVRAGNFDIQAEEGTQDEIGILAATFNGMTSQIRTLVSTLEQRVADRTRALSTSTEVSRRLSTILDQDELVREVVEQVKNAFDYYHVHIYLWDERHENLVMAGGTGEAGRTMLASGHFIPAERGLVGRAAETGIVVLVPDVSQTIGWLPNPLLPDTKAEIAVPILIGEDVLGVLDVQHYLVNGLAQNDADLLQSIANQVAIALQNARAYATAQRDVRRKARRSEIVQKIQGTTRIEDALKVAVRELGRAMGTETSVRLKSAVGHENNTTPVKESAS